KVRHVYQLYGASTNLGLLITEGPHQDTQDLQLPVLRWFNRFLKDQDPLIETAAKKYFEPEQLKVFVRLPADQSNTNIEDSFVPLAGPAPVPTTPQQWNEQRGEWIDELRAKCFAAWPATPLPLGLEKDL